MNTYNLTLLVAGVDEEHLDEIYEATDGAANVELGDRWTSTVGYDIQADTFADAALRAIELIEEVPGLRVVRVEPDQLVWASEIAERIGRTRQSIDQLVKAQRGPGGFPPPASENVRNPLWRWAEVEAWFAATNTARSTPSDRPSSGRSTALWRHGETCTPNRTPTWPPSSKH